MGSVVVNWFENKGLVRASVIAEFDGGRFLGGRRERDIEDQATIARGNHVGAIVLWEQQELLIVAPVIFELDELPNASGDQRVVGQEGWSERRVQNLRAIEYLSRVSGDNAIDFAERFFWCHGIPLDRYSGQQR